MGCTIPMEFLRGAWLLAPLRDDGETGASIVRLQLEMLCGQILRNTNANAGPASTSAQCRGGSLLTVRVTLYIVTSTVTLTALFIIFMRTKHVTLQHRVALERTHTKMQPDINSKVKTERGGRHPP